MVHVTEGPAFFTNTRSQGGTKVEFEMPTDVGVFTEISEELETEEVILIVVRTFGVQLILYGLSVSSPESMKPGGNLGVVQVSREIESGSRNGRDRYYCK